MPTPIPFSQYQQQKGTSLKNTAVPYSEYIKNKSLITPTEPKKSFLQKTGDFFKSAITEPINSLLVKPAVRTGEALGAGGIKASELFMSKDQKQKTDASLQNALGKDINTPVGTVNAVKPIGQGGVKQIAGEALEAGGNIALGVGGGEVATAPAEDLVKQGVKTGIKTGAIFGGAQGASTGLQNNESTKKIAEDTAIGAGTGAVGGAVLGAVGGKIGQKITQTSEDRALEIISPKLTSTEKEAAVTSGRTKTSGLFNSIKVTPDKQTKEAAKVVADIVKPNKTLSENVNLVRGAISEEANALKQKIGTVNHPYTFKELNSKLASVDKPISIKSDATLSKQFDLVRQAFMDIAKKNGGDVSSLLDSRKEFDQLVDKEFPNLYDRENAPMRNAITSIRNEVNNFIEDNLPNDVSYKDSLKKQSLMYHAIDNMGTKAKDEVGTNSLNRFSKRNPAFTKGAGYVGYATAAGIGVGGAVEAGKKILGQ